MLCSLERKVGATLLKIAAKDLPFRALATSRLKSNRPLTQKKINELTLNITGKGILSKLYLKTWL